jgi:Fe-S-cluster-containing dehydrogenase component
MKLSRRGFLRVAAITGSTAAVGATASRARAAGADHAGEDECAMLVDTTVCAGCRACEAACSEANNLPPPAAEVDVLKERRDTGPEAFTVVNGTEGPDGEPRYAKRQCMHCLEPACASACPVRALDKQPNGPVVYRGDRCMGCRYCMVACPFEIPKYQYDKVAPLVRKCQFCAKRQAEGKKPACAEVCPTGALTFGKRGALIELAKHRIYRTPDKYIHHVYGEHEAGGTNWLYISDVKFEKLAMRTVRDEAYPDKVQGALGAPPFVMTLWPPLLMGLYTFSQRKNGNGNGHGHDEAPKATSEDKGGSHG